MRGAALKVGQFLGIQGPYTRILPRTSTNCNADTHVLCTTTGARPGLSPRSGQCALHAQPADGGARRTLIQRVINLRTDSFPTSECNGIVPQSIVALLLRKFQPRTLRGCLDWAGITTTINKHQSITMAVPAERSVPVTLG